MNPLKYSFFPSKKPSYGVKVPLAGLQKKCKWGDGAKKLFVIKPSPIYWL
jgi:hypothetical protein